MAVADVPGDALRPLTGDSDASGAIDPFADDVGVPAVAGVLRDHARANCAVRRLDDVSPFMGGEVSLRWIYTHMIAEYARHCGHADVIRERIDGATGV